MEHKIFLFKCLRFSFSLQFIVTVKLFFYLLCITDSIQLRTFYTFFFLFLYKVAV